jgi:hypothetical protein
MSSVVVSVTVTGKDAGVEPTGMYSRRVTETTTEGMPHKIPFYNAPENNPIPHPKVCVK